MLNIWIEIKCRIIFHTSQSTVRSIQSSLLAILLFTLTILYINKFHSQFSVLQKLLKVFHYDFMNFCLYLITPWRQSPFTTDFYTKWRWYDFTRLMFQLHTVYKFHIKINSWTSSFFLIKTQFQILIFVVAIQWIIEGCYNHLTMWNQQGLLLYTGHW